MSSVSVFHSFYLHSFQCSRSPISAMVISSNCSEWRKDQCVVAKLQRQCLSIMGLSGNWVLLYVLNCLGASEEKKNRIIRKLEKHILVLFHVLQHLSCVKSHWDSKWEHFPLLRPVRICMGHVLQILNYCSVPCPPLKHPV